MSTIDYGRGSGTVRVPAAVQHHRMRWQGIPRISEDSVGQWLVPALSAPAVGMGPQPKAERGRAVGRLLVGEPERARAQPPDLRSSRPALLGNAEQRLMCM